MADIPEHLQRPVVYTQPGMTEIPVQRDRVYREVDGVQLKMDVYTPPGLVPGERRPAVIFVHGDAPPAVLAQAKDWGQYVGWGQLAASSGLVGITFTHRSAEGRTRLPEACSDVATAIDYVRSHAADLGVDPDRLGFWVCSGGGFKLKLALGATPTPPAYIRCIVAYYPVLDLSGFREYTPPEVSDETLRSFSAITYVSGQAAPLLLVRAGLDHPALNAGIDRFVQAAAAQNMALDFYNHPTGEHGFDVANPGARSQEIIAQTLAFMQRHLRG